MKSAPPNGDSVRVAQASPKVLAVVAKAIAEMGAPAGAAGAAEGETLVGASFVYWSAGGGVRVASGSGCCGSQEVVAALAVMGDKLDAVAKGAHELRKENDDLRRLALDGYFKCALKIDALDFQYFAAILLLGDRAKAARELKVDERRFYERVDTWQQREAVYQRMFGIVAARKKALRKGTVRLGQSVQSGGTGEEGENPEVLQGLVDQIKAGNLDQSGYPKLLQEILNALKDMSAENWRAIRDEIVPMIREEVPQ
jgi:hypothetical protein